MAERLRRLLAGFSGRDRLLMVSVIAFATVALLFIAVVKPLSNARDANAHKLADRNELLEWITARAVEARALRGSKGGSVPAAATPGIAEVEASLGGRGLRPSLARLTPKPGGRFEARFEDAPYTDLVTWLAESQERLGVTVNRIAIEATGRSGHVDAEFTALLGTGQR